MRARAAIALAAAVLAAAAGVAQASARPVGGDDGSLRAAAAAFEASDRGAQAASALSAAADRAGVPWRHGAMHWFRAADGAPAAACAQARTVAQSQLAGLVQSGACSRRVAAAAEAQMASLGCYYGAQLNDRSVFGLHLGWITFAFNCNSEVELTNCGVVGINIVAAPAFHGGLAPALGSVCGGNSTYFVWSGSADFIGVAYAESGSVTYAGAYDLHN